MKWYAFSAGKAKETKGEAKPSLFTQDYVLAPHSSTKCDLASFTRGWKDECKFRTMGKFGEAIELLMTI